jgi:hypothetical protein
MTLLLLAKRVRASHRLFSSMLIMLALITAAFALWMTNAPTLNAEDKCTICHVPPGNPANAHTLVVGCSAVDAHMRNHPGDCLGPCPCQVTQSQNP